jgi:hypothetical protein
LETLELKALTQTTIQATTNKKMKFQDEIFKMAPAMFIIVENK